MIEKINPQPAIRNPQFLLCAIVDVEAAARFGRPPIDIARAFLSGGARFLQLRAKTAPSGAFLDLASAIATDARAAGATLIVNDRADIARLADAGGVHVGQEDLSPRDTRAVVGSSAVVGLSTHTVAQIDRALDEPVDYLAVGPVFGSITKATGYDAVGLGLVREAAARTRVAGKPLVAIGGITLKTAASVIEAGAASVAVIGDLVSTGDPEQRVREYIRMLGRL